LQQCRSRTRKEQENLECLGKLKIRVTCGGRNLAETDRKKIATDWASRAFSCDLWTDLPGQRSENFTHATDELVTVLEGRMEFEVAGKVHHPQVGQELLISAGAVHPARDLGTTHAFTGRG
jgi:mannose-6-phosphate isomerase-like protein (cupin superfamily)